MADIAVVAASVSLSGTSTFQGVAGETITAGQSVYLKTSDGRLWKALANGTAEQGTVKGVALHASLAGQPLQIGTGGDLTLSNSTPMTVGVAYYNSPNNAGGIAPVADIASTHYVTILGVAKTAAVLTLNINNSGYQHA